MTTKTLRLPDSLVAAAKDVGAGEQIEEATALRKLLRMGYDLYVAEQYRMGRITLRAAARKLELSLSETLDRFQRLGIAGNTTADDTLQSIRSLANRGG